MLIKNIFGTFILLLNTAGLGYLFFLGSKTLMKKFSPPKDVEQSKTGQPLKKQNTLKKQNRIQNDYIVPDEDDLLKDMDLSDLDNLNLDDFE